MYCAISRSCKCIAQYRDRATIVRNLEIAQILGLRGTYIYVSHIERGLWELLAAQLQLSGRALAAQARCHRFKSQ